MLELMAVGDSITHAKDGDFSWRYRLHEHLRSYGVAFDFAGPSEAPFDEAPLEVGDYAITGWDDAHAASWGQPTVEAKMLISEDVELYKPDLVLVHLGTNDLTWLQGTPAGARADMSELIGNARAVDPEIDFVIAQIGDTVPLEDWDLISGARPLNPDQMRPACLDIPYATTQPSTQLQIWDCSEQPQQIFYMYGFKRDLPDAYL